MTELLLSNCPNLGFFLTRLSTLSPCRSLDLPGGGFCLATGSNFASDNWAIGVPTPSSLQAAFQFFHGIPFIWPLFERTPQSIALLTGEGLLERGRLLAMSRDLSGELRPQVDCVFRTVNSAEDSARWAEAVWRGFGGEGGAPDGYLALAGAMRGEKALRLMTAQLRGRDVGSFLVAFSKDEAGVYYFSVLPEFRRQGIASAMMEEIRRLAEALGRTRIVLQATPAGVPFYLSAGFSPLREIPLFSASDDVF